MRNLLYVVKFPSVQSAYVLGTDGDGSASINFHWYCDDAGNLTQPSQYIQALYIDGTLNTDYAPGSLSLGDGNFHVILMTGVNLGNLSYSFNIGREVQEGPTSWPIGTEIKAIATWGEFIPTGVMPSSLVEYNTQVAQSLI
jgi:hypothetical protein